MERAEFFPSTREPTVREPPFEGDRAIVLIGISLALLLAVEIVLFLVRPPAFEFWFISLAFLMAVLEAYGGYRIAVPRTSPAYRRQVKAYLQGIRTYCPICDAEFGRIGLDGHVTKYHPALYGRVLYGTLVIGIILALALTSLLFVAFMAYDPSFEHPFLAFLVSLFASSLCAVFVAQVWHQHEERRLRKEWSRNHMVSRPREVDSRKSSRP
jgi:uncharacterized protein YacL